MAATTQAADVLDALVASARVGLPEDVVVIDGQPKRGFSDPDVLILGWSYRGPAVEVVQEDADVGGGRSEVLSINCLASVARGETDDQAVAEARRRAVEIVDLLVAVLDVDPTLSGAVSEVRFGMASELDQAQVGDGVEATVPFTVFAEVL